MGNAKFRGLPAIFKKNCMVDYVGDPTTHASIGFSRFKGGVSAHAWNCHPQASIFFFFRLHAHRCRSARWTERMVAVNGSNDAPRWPLRPFYGFVNKKNIFPYFSPKNVKNCITPYGKFEHTYIHTYIHT